jgi:hypothetical protein
LLALPLTVVVQIWVRRVLMEDVLDRWQAPSQFRFGSASDGAENNADAQPAIVTETVIQPVASSPDDLATTGSD